MLAYLDATSGSLVLTALAGGAAGIAVLFRMYWNRLLGVVSPSRRAAAAAAREELLGGGEGADAGQGDGSTSAP